MPYEIIGHNHQFNATLQNFEAIRGVFESVKMWIFSKQEFFISQYKKNCRFKGQSSLNDIGMIIVN